MPEFRGREFLIVRYLAKGNVNWKKFTGARSLREVLVWGQPPSPTAKAVAMGRSVGGIDLNSCFSQLFIRHSQPPRRRTTTTDLGAGKATTYFNSSFPCEFLAWTYDQLLTLQLRGLRAPRVSCILMKSHRSVYLKKKPRFLSISRFVRKRRHHQCLLYGVSLNVA